MVNIMNEKEIDYNLLEVEKGNKRYGIYLKNHIQDQHNRILDLLKDNTEYKLENERLNNIINELDKWLNHSIESINEKLDNARDKSGIIYSMNDYQILRLRTFRTKMNEVLDKLKELKEKKWNI